NRRLDVIKSAPGWVEELASESEADVKADREPLPRDLRELQDETIEAIRSRHHTEMETAAHNLKQDFDKATRELKKEVKRFGREMNQAEDEFIMDSGQEGFDALKGLDLGLKDKSEGVKTHVEHAEDSVIDEVKAGAQRMSSFMKGSVDSVKKTVGLGGANDQTSAKNKRQYGDMRDDKIKQKVKNVDDNVDSDRGA
ncbi:hypothetical protein BGX28_008070, partial [Mortierella sp. GBA30]